MRRNSMKFHLIAIGIICVVVTGLFFTIGPKPQKPDDGMATGDRYVSIFSASWGLNCNSEITRLKNQPVTLNPDGTAPAPLKLAMPDNVLIAVGNLCNGRLGCSVQARTDVLGEDPLPTCFKELKVSYRCFAIDRLWEAKVNQNERLTLDCSEAADKDRK